MRYWLFKSEPSTWSWADQLAKGAAGEEWDGVRNYQARNFMREMAVGDRGFFYHSQKAREIVGIVEIVEALWIPRMLLAGVRACRSENCKLVSSPDSSI